jgi:hypothetical protein
MTLPTLDSLFDEYAGFPDASREAFAFANPRLLALASVETLAQQRGASAALAQLAGLQARLARHPDSYQLGAGPIEDLLARESDPNRMIEIVRSDEFQARVAPIYFRVLGQAAAELARGDDWRASAYISLLNAQAALAWEPKAPTHALVAEAMLLHLQTAVFACTSQLDDGIFEWALASANELLLRVEARGERDAIGLLCHGIGMLFSDIWTVPGRPDDRSRVDARVWVARRVANPGLFGPAGDPPTLPPPAESLRVAIAWYERSLPFRTGLRRGLTYKAIAQTLHFAKRVIGEKIEEPLFSRCMALAPELLEKHPDPTHLQVLASIAAANGLTLGGPGEPLPKADQQLLTEIRADAAPLDTAAPDSADRRASHDAALHDLERVLRHGLPWVLCLRNFDYANEYFRLGEDIVEERGATLRIVVPRIRYSLVDHRILQLFPEGAVAISDPRTLPDPRLTNIPMFALGDRWAVVAEALMARCTRIVMLIDAVSPGVQAEFDLLAKLQATARTLIVTGHHYRETKTEPPAEVTARFPYIVDWVDFGFNESYASQRYKAHGIIADELHRYVRRDARPVVSAWLGGVGPAIASSNT